MKPKMNFSRTHTVTGRYKIEFPPTSICPSGLLLNINPFFFFSSGIQAGKLGVVKHKFIPLLLLFDQCLWGCGQQLSAEGTMKNGPHPLSKQGNNIQYLLCMLNALKLFWLRFIPSQAPGGHQQPTLGFFTPFWLLPTDMQHREDSKYIPMYRLK